MVQCPLPPSLHFCLPRLCCQLYAPFVHRLFRNRALCLSGTYRDLAPLSRDKKVCLTHPTPPPPNVTPRHPNQACPNPFPPVCQEAFLKYNLNHKAVTGHDYCPFCMSLIFTFRGSSFSSALRQ